MQKPTTNIMVELKEFKKSFGSKQVHNGINLKIQKGDCIGLLGGSGAGKSVILRSLIGLERPDSGEIWIDGTEITRLRERDMIPIRKKVAYVFQGGALFDSMSVYENLAYPLREHTTLSEAQIEQKIFSLLEEFGLQGAEMLFPSNLSGGMQKRVGLARAIIMEPDVVLYDEPTAGLDPYNTKKIQEMILKLKAKHVTSILVTHDMPSAFAVCDQLALLLKGKIHSVSSTREIQNTTQQNPELKFVQQFINGDQA